MTIVNHFYNGTTKRYIALFGSLFNKLSITREDETGVEVQRMIIPISYGPYQKFLARIKQDPDLNRGQAISLPRMSFEIMSMNYDGVRKTNSLNRVFLNDTAENKRPFTYSPAPYNIEFNLYVMTKYAEDGTKILEQVLPFFKPEYTFTAKIIDNLDPIDLPLVLNSVSAEDVYEADFETRRSLIWTLSFTFKVWFFGPVRDPKVIKFADVGMYNGMDPNLDPSSRVTVQPGMTSSGQPTSDPNETIPYEQIEVGDDWGIITVIEDLDEIDNT